MDLRQAISKLSLLPVRLRIAPRETLKLPSINKSNTLRGAFGMAFRRLVCIPQCREPRRCPLDGTCPYRVIFEPAPPPGAARLSKNQDIPRPFIFRAPLDVSLVGERSALPRMVGERCGLPREGGALPYPFPPRGAAHTHYDPGEAFDFILTLIGKGVDYLPYFILAFREVAREGIGLNRARCELEEIRSLNPESVFDPPESGTLNLESQTPNPESRIPTPESSLIYSSADELFRSPQAFTLGDYVQARLAQLSLSPVNCRLSTVFLTPTYLKSEGKPVRQPEFHHLFKRVRDRLNALCTFYGPGPIDADFKGLGAAAEKVRTVARHVQWVERSRRSSKTGQRHELSGFVGECVFDLSTVDCQLSTVDTLLRWLICGEFLHVGRHTAWGNGWYEVHGAGDGTSSGLQWSHQLSS